MNLILSVISVFPNGTMDIVIPSLSLSPRSLCFYISVSDHYTCFLTFKKGHTIMSYQPIMPPVDNKLIQALCLDNKSAWRITMSRGIN